MALVDRLGRDGLDGRSSNSSAANFAALSLSAQDTTVATGCSSAAVQGVIAVQPIYE